MRYTKSINTLSALLIFSSCGLVMASLTKSPLSIGPLGVLEAFSPLFYLGFGVLLVGFSLQFVNPEPSKALVGIQVILAEVYLWLVPPLVLPGLVLPASAHDLFFYTDFFSIVQTGHLNSAVYVYQSFPGPYILTAIVKELLSPASFLMLAKTAALGLNLIASLFLFVFLRSQLGSQNILYPAMGVLLFQMFNFTEQLTTLTPFAAGTLYFYFYVFVMAALVARRVNVLRPTRIAIPLMVVAAALSITHPLIGIEAQAAVSVLLVYEIRFARLRLTPVVPLLLLPFLLIGGVSLFLASQQFLSGNLPTIIGSVSNFLGGFFGGTLQSYQSTSASHVLVNNAKLAVFLSMIGLAAPSFIGSLVKRSPQGLRLLAVAIAITIATFFVAGAGGTNFNVYYIAAILPVVVILDLNTLSSFPRRGLVVAALVILAASTPVSYLVIYGNVVAEVPSQPSLSASVFYSEYASPTGLTNSHTITGLQYIGYYGPNLETILPYTYPEEGTLQSIGTLNAQFVALGEGAVYIAKFTFGNSTLVEASMSRLQGSSSWVPFYSSDGVMLYAKT